MKDPWISAKQATKHLGVTQQTLYAYVSRGLVRSEPVPGEPRVRRYAREDVERLGARAEERRDPEKAARRALQWGLPVLESSIALVAGGRLYYRGHDVEALARERSVEEVASLLWSGNFDQYCFEPARLPSLRQPAIDSPFTARAMSLLPLAAQEDPMAFDLRPPGVTRTGGRIVQLLTRIAGGTNTPPATIDAALAEAWNAGGDGALAIIRAALILAADHELNVSAFTARCIASAGANPYSVVGGALAALEGVRHGGATVRVASLFSGVRRAGDLSRALAERLRRGESVEGFGHALYPKGDPRAALLLAMLAEHYPKSKETAFARDLADAGREILREEPTVDFALVAVARTLGLPDGAPRTLFAIGRTLGWIAHAIEQYANAAVIRPRARYIGVMP